MFGASVARRDPVPTRLNAGTKLRATESPKPTMVGLGSGNADVKRPDAMGVPGRRPGTVSPKFPPSTTSAPSVDSRAIQVLLFVLSATAGCTDVIGFLGLNGLFTAHITGNLVVLTQLSDRP
jgi:hypothetical protein